LLPLIQIKNLTVDFPGTESSGPALQDFSIELQRGEIVAVVGESGSGKSVMSLTLMNLLSKSARVVQGSILFSSGGKESIQLLGMSENKYRSFRGNQMAMIFQEPMTSLNPVVTCGSQVTEQLILHKKISKRQAKTEAQQLFEKVQLPEPERIYNSYPHQISGGQKQRVMIAMAISCKPSLLICDEPTTALDVRVQKTILDLLKGLRHSENMGMIFITHDLGLVADIADRAVVMLRGRVVESGPVKDIFANPRHPYTRGLLMCRPAFHKKGERLPVISDFLETPSEKVVTSTDSTFNSVNSRSNFVREEKNSILLTVKNLHLRYAGGKNWLGREKYGVNAVQDVSFDVYRGETLGIVGESGSGKTSLGREVLGLMKPVSGSISYGNLDLLKMTPSELLKFRRNIQIVFQDPYSSLNPRKMVGNAISETLSVHEKLDRVERKARVLKMLEKVDLKPEHFNRFPHAFSGGQRQRIVIARALTLDPGFVVFDESVSALDVSVQAQVLNLINDLKKSLGFTAVFISHDLSVIRYLCDRVLVMENGRIVESGPTETVYKYPQTKYTQSLIDAIPEFKESGLSIT
jgi:peptide/nickel transport system ATP-binding protein